MPTQADTATAFHSEHSPGGPLSRMLDTDFFLQPDVVRTARRLLGKWLFTRMGRDETTGGMIVETEAYAGTRDRASHAYGNRRTKRTETMFRRGGIAYVYLCYGMYPLLNIVTNAQDVPDAVLIRAIKPTHGAATMLKRRKKKKADHTLAAGPGCAAVALGVSVSHDGMPLTGQPWRRIKGRSAAARMWIEDRGYRVPRSMILALPRVGVDYAGKHAKLPWRFKIADKNFDN